MNEMTVNLMFRDRSFDLKAAGCYGKLYLAENLSLTHVINVMSQGDDVIRDVCDVAISCPLTDAEDIVFRQRILEDINRNASAVRKLYDTVSGALMERRADMRTFSATSPTKVYLKSLDIFTVYVNALIQIRVIADSEANNFTTETMLSMFSMFRRELNDVLFNEAEAVIKDAPNIYESVVTASLNDDMIGVDYTLRKVKKDASWLKWQLAPLTNFDTDPSGVITGTNDWENRRERAYIDLAFIFEQAVRYIETFFEMLRRELAFYIGCLNLSETLREYGMPVCIPKLTAATSHSRSYRNLYDVALALAKRSVVVGNDLSADDVKLHIITGANQGGKTTFLRSVGQAQLMAQCGMYVAAESAEIPLRRAVFTHFKREEDSGMRSGKLDEEVRRMSEIIDHAEPFSMLLMNESFASTNEREGSEICRQVTRAFVKNDVEVFSVSHMYDYASSFADAECTVFLRAQRMEDGTRTFKLEIGEPLTTAFGRELYKKIFGEDGTNKRSHVEVM